MASAGRTRPSLLGTAPAPAPVRDFELSILDALNTPEAASPRPPARASRRRATIIWMALLGIAAAGIGSVRLRSSIEAAAAPDGHAGHLHQAALRAPTTPPAASAAAAESVALASPAPASEQAQAARIEDMVEPSAATAPAAAAPASAAASRATASPFDQLTRMPTAAVPSATKAQQARPAKKTPPQRSSNEPNARATRAASKAAPASRVAGHSPSHAPARASAGKPTAQSDADVEIMAALIGHMNESNAASSTADASIADLVRHCRSLPGADAQACQRRICQGYWGRAEACPRDRQAALRMVGSPAP